MLPRVLGVVPRVLGVVPSVLGVVPRVLGVVPRVLGGGPQGTGGRWRPVAAAQAPFRSAAPLSGATPRKHVAGIRSPGSVAGNIFCAGEELGTDDPVRLRRGVGVRTPGGS